MMTRHNTTLCRQHGATLVEVIVAILLLASCVIGIAAIYAQRQNIARGGREHEHAVELAQQIAASIRQASSSKDNFETALGANCNSKLSKLDPTTNLVACWQDSVEKELTDGSARISLDRSTVPEQYVIVVSWSEPHNGTASYVLRVVAGSGDKAATAIAGSGATRAAG